jgi:hypothetical protein
MRKFLLVFVFPLLYLITIVVLMSLAGCVTSPLNVQEVKVPVRVACVKHEPVRPDYETKHLTPDASDGAKILALARDWLRSRKYEGELEAAVEGCK